MTHEITLTFSDKQWQNLKSIASFIETITGEGEPDLDKFFHDIADGQTITLFGPNDRDGASDFMQWQADKAKKEAEADPNDQPPDPNYEVTKVKFTRFAQVDYTIVAELVVDCETPENSGMRYYYNGKVLEDGGHDINGKRYTIGGKSWQYPAQFDPKPHPQDGGKPGSWLLDQITRAKYGRKIQRDGKDIDLRISDVKLFPAA